MVLGFQDEDDARRLLEALKERFGHFGLAIHEPWYSVAAGPQVTFQKSPLR